MLENGSKVQDYFSKENLIFYEEDGLYHILIPKKTTLKQRIRTDDHHFLSFLKSLLEIDPGRRPSAQQALSHPFLQ
jgi:dual specificity tyrosine-phosphorylation-regulated kinase 2/3/4